MLEIEFKYYLDNQSELVKKYNNKYLVIIKKEVVGIYDSKPEAYFDSLSKYEEGSFLIQLCNEGDSSYTQSFHSRVKFN